MHSFIHVNVQSVQRSFLNTLNIGNWDASQYLKYYYQYQAPTLILIVTLSSSSSLRDEAEAIQYRNRQSSSLRGTSRGNPEFSL